MTLTHAIRTTLKFVGTTLAAAALVHTPVGDLGSIAFAKKPGGGGGGGGRPEAHPVYSVSINGSYTVDGETQETVPNKFGLTQGQDVFVIWGTGNPTVVNYLLPDGSVPPAGHLVLGSPDDGSGGPVNMFAQEDGNHHIVDVQLRIFDADGVKYDTDVLAVDDSNGHEVGSTAPFTVYPIPPVGSGGEILLYKNTGNGRKAKRTVFGKIEWTSFTYTPPAP